MKKGTLWVATACLSALLSRGASTQIEPELPVEVFFNNPDLSQMSLSPDGKFLAALGSWRGESMLFGIDLVSGDRKQIALGYIYDFDWVTDQRLVYREATDGFGGLYAVDRDGSNNVELHPPFWTFGGGDVRAVEVLSIPVEPSDWILVESAYIRRWGPARILHPEVRRLNHRTGKSIVEERNPGSVVDWLADGRGQVRAAVAIEKDQAKVLYRNQPKEAWRVISQFPVLESRINPLSFSADDHLYVAARGSRDTLGIFKFDVEACQLGQSLWHDERFDVYALRKSMNSSSVLGIFYHSERPQTVWLDKGWERLQRQIDSRLTNTINVLIDSSRDLKKHLFRTFSDRTPGAYYLVDTENSEFGIVGKVAGWIDDQKMAEVKPISYRSRDGLIIHGYLTLPRGREPKKLPLIVMPHGGPWTRDHWIFDREVQFFANRGYAVLQMNFRGSTGYGLTFHQAGFKQWGLRMQNDITDGVRWAIDQGIADPTRVGIFGTSYGGYAALMGLITTPELYRCGISYAGVTEINLTLKKWGRRQPRLALGREIERVGDYLQRPEDLEAVSPLHHVDKIQAPLLLAYGGKDWIVDIEQGRKLARALKKAGKEFELIVEKNEGHGFSNETNRANLFRQIDVFLKRHL